MQEFASRLLALLPSMMEEELEATRSKLAAKVSGQRFPEYNVAELQLVLEKLRRQGR